MHQLLQKAPRTCLGLELLASHANYEQECRTAANLHFFFLSFSRINLPGRYYELNVHFGIFVGGMGNFNEIFLGNRENFRGCLDSVFFNGRDVLSQAKVRKIIPFL